MVKPFLICTLCLCPEETEKKLKYVLKVGISVVKVYL